MAYEKGEAFEMAGESFVCFGYYGKQNLGDEAILASFLHEIEKYGHDRSRVRVATADRTDTVKRHGVIPIKRFSIFARVAAVMRSDHIVLSGGGWHFQKLWVASYAALTALLAKLLGKSFSIICIGVEPITRLSSRHLVRAILGASDWVSVRDEESAQELLRTGASTRVVVAADPVFSEVYSKVAQSQQRVYRGPCSRPVITVSLLDARGAKKYAAIREDYPSIVDGIVDRLDAEVVLVCTSPGEGDIEVARYVQESCTCPDRVHIYECGESLVDLMPVVASSDLVVGMRYHALATAALAGVPFAAIARSPKVQSICDVLGQPVLAHVNCYDGDDIIEGVCESFAQRQSLGKKLNERVPMMVDKYHSSMESWVRMLARRKAGA
ncbi:MAG: polysaccharide pyruvyl transferase family protein [Bacillota bacterium]